jgi:hypothetical protein
MQALNMKMEMVSGANLVEEAIDLVDRSIKARVLVLYTKRVNKP